MYKKILWLTCKYILYYFKLSRVNQQVTLLNKGTSETECDITFNFNDYSSVLPKIS
jgi:hypothetical protein